MRSYGLFVVIALVSSGCAGLSDNIYAVASKHSILANPQGALVSLRDPDGPPMTEKESEEYLDGIVDQISTYVDHNDTEPARVLIYIHGGLNIPSGSVYRAGCLAHAIVANDETEMRQCARRGHEPIPPPKELNDKGFFPIFINWRSGLTTSYLEHLVSLRQGERWSQPWGLLSSPFVLLADIGRGIVRAPLVWIQQGRTGLRTYEGTLRSSNRKSLFSDSDKPYYHYLELHTAYRNAAEKLPNQNNAIAVSVARDNGPPGIFSFVEGSNRQRDYYDKNGPHGSWWEGAAGFGTWLITLPTKLILAPMIDAAGTSAWDVMLRRTELLRRQPAEFEEGADLYPEPSGAVSELLNKLVDEFPKEKGQIEVTIIGHSMGTIVANWIIADYGARLDFKNIVYMAAASTISDFEDKVIPYLASEEGATTEFYNLTLHPKAEDRERNGDLGTKIFDFAPRGSLLVWIDSYLANPENLLERTLGRWDNIISAPQIFPESTRSRVHIKAFGVCRWGTKNIEQNPEQHGEFDEGPFWRSEFWIPEQPGMLGEPVDYCAE